MTLVDGVDAGGSLRRPLFLWKKSQVETKVRCARTKNEGRVYPPYGQMTL
jgi:hypothetical protein